MNRAAALGCAAVALGLGLFCAMGCPSPEHGSGDRPPGFRLVRGIVEVPSASSLGQQITGLQIAGIAIGTQQDPARIDIFPSDVLDVAHVQSAAFSAPVDGKRSFVLVLQVPSASARGPGTLVATLDDLLPPGEDDIDLGVIHVEGDAPDDAVLVLSDANDPYAQIDTDGDGTPDASDDDDDGDGTPDATDPDVGGDGVDDVKQVLSALPDDDRDGVADLLQP